MTDVIGEMLNDTSKDMRYKRIFIYDIDPCEYNMYPMQEIEQLAQNISECGLLHPITLYRKADGRYMILSGERRYRAMLLNYEKGDERWEEISAIVKMQELTMREIQRFVRRGNANRETAEITDRKRSVAGLPTNERGRTHTYRNTQKRLDRNGYWIQCAFRSGLSQSIGGASKQGEKGIAIFKIRRYTEFDA